MAEASVAIATYSVPQKEKEYVGVYKVVTICLMPGDNNSV